MALVVIRVPEETSVLRPQHWLKVAKSTHLLQRLFERPCRGILDGDRHLFLAFYGFKRHDEHVSQQDLLEILASFASSGQPVQGGITGEPFATHVKGRHAVLTRTFRPWMSVSGRAFSEEHTQCIIYDAMVP